MYYTAIKSIDTERLLVNKQRGYEHLLPTWRLGIHSFLLWIAMKMYLYIAFGFIVGSEDITMEPLSVFSSILQMSLKYFNKEPLAFITILTFDQKLVNLFVKAGQSIFKKLGKLASHK
ncbi:hypothetical protein BDF21DRAFT_404444 [Thamnidium elegans]|nr:hypothetical protein BDF21DRAFT_404444 [Thamnidium elegans]